jgi:hypothetical protein
MKLPKDQSIDSAKLSGIFNNTTATYKFYWFLGILDEVENDHLVIPKEVLFAKMISAPWYTVNYYQINFGVHDKIQENMLLLKQHLNLQVSAKKGDIERMLTTSNDRYVKGLLWHFNKNVPFKFLSPWIGACNESQAKEKSSAEGFSGIYTLLDDHIKVHENWGIYLKKHGRILRDFTYWNLIQFVQRRNPGIPDIPLKLIRPISRESLTPYRNNYWHHYLKMFPETTCIFSNQRLDLDNYHIDHFIPHSFLPQNQIWNLLPISDTFNIQKGNKVPDMDKYFEPFYQLQKDAYIFLREKLGPRRMKKFQDEYLNIYHTEAKLAEFSFNAFRDTIAPQITVALNNGFEKLV